MYRDGDGNLRWEGKFHSRTDAQRRLTSVLGEIDKGTYTRPSSLAFEQFSKEWLAGRRQLRGSTGSGYESVIKSQLIPRLGSLTVSHIRFEHVDAAVSGMVEDELAPKTIHNAVLLLRNMLADLKVGNAEDCRATRSCRRDAVLAVSDFSEEEVKGMRGVPDFLVAGGGFEPPTFGL